MLLGPSASSEASLRTIRHWTPGYVLHRSREWAYRHSHPGTPWLTPRATELLDQMLLPTDRGLEFGSGWSTRWFAQRIHHLVSVEHDQTWHHAVSQQLKDDAVDNVDHVFVPETDGGGSEYVGVAARFADQSLHFVLVDGIYRDHCARRALPKIAAGGMLVIDNVNWFLPSNSRSPHSRSPADGAANEVWQEVAETVAGWRTIWTSCGVTDTAIFVRP
ncbi:hypothetical protein [Micromonospora sp. DT31]|uniref:hypothetical protein n=1 Tax=Micromonospora sp. DT31 TaxID=3393434 RepID=UPI003CE6E6D6